MTDTETTTEMSGGMSMGKLLYYFLKGLKRFWYIVIVFAALGGCLMVLRYTRSYIPVYTATATFTVSTDLAGIGGEYYNSATATQLASTFPYILTSSQLSRVVAKDLRMSYMPGVVKAEALEGTNLFMLTVTASNAQNAYDVLISVISNYPEIAQYVIGSTQLNLISQPVLPTTPTNPRDILPSAEKGMLLGAAAGLALLAFYAVLSHTILTNEDIQTQLNCHFVGALPDMSGHGDSGVSKRRSRQENNNKQMAPTILQSRVGHEFKESVSSLRNTVLREMQQKNRQVLLVSGTGVGEGKTTVAINIALALARRDCRVVLLDGDMRRCSLRTAMGLAAGTSTLTRVLRGEAVVRDALVAVPHSGLQVMFSDPPRNKQEIAALLGHMDDLIDTLRKQFDYIVIDTPPVGVVSDAVDMSQAADALLYVVRQDFVDTRQIRKAIGSFSEADVHMIGCVLNRAKGMAFGRRGKYGYGRYGTRYGSRRYGYGYGGRYGYGGYYGYGEQAEDEEDVSPADSEAASQDE